MLSRRRGTLVVHVWAVVVWLPLITMLSVERSLWVACIVPWAFANAITFLNLWSVLERVEEPAASVGRVLLEPMSTPALWRTLLPSCITIVMVQAGLGSLTVGHAWSAAALFSSGVMLFLVRQPLVRGAAKSRRRFSQFFVAADGRSVFPDLDGIDARVAGGVWAGWAGGVSGAIVLAGGGGRKGNCELGLLGCGADAAGEGAPAGGAAEAF